MVGWSCTCVTSVHATALIRTALQLRHACWVARTCRAAWGASLVHFMCEASVTDACLSLLRHRQGLVGPLPHLVPFGYVAALL